jgi:peroxiredoxin
VGFGQLKATRQKHADLSWLIASFYWDGIGCIMAEKTTVELLQEKTDACRLMDGPLSVRLRTVADEVRRLSPEFADTVDRLVAGLAANGVGLTAPKPGEIMPEFVLPDSDGHFVSLAALLEQSMVVVSFNRGHWCPYCQLDVDALAKAAPEIQALGGQVVVISPETQSYTKAMKGLTNAPFPILTDMDGGYALETNLLFWVGDEKRDAMKASGCDIEPYQGNNTWMLPIPATFVVGRDGVVKARFIDPDYRRRMEIDDLMAALKA